MTKRIRSTKTRNVASIIDQNAETTVSLGAIDHASQLTSWSSTDTDSDAVLDQAVQNLETEIVTDATLTTDETGEDLDLIVAKLEAHEPTEEDHTVGHRVIGEEPEEQGFDSLTASIDEEEVDEMVWAIKDAVDDRESFERSENPDNDSIQKTLKKVRSAMVTKRAARVLIACNAKPDFINRSISSGARYNVYALGKVADLMVGLTGGVVANAINVACMKSLFSFQRAGVPFTSLMSKAAASDKIRVEMALRKLLISHTVSDKTAPTQASSTMQAFETLGIVARSGSRKDSTYTLTAHPVVAKLEGMLAA